LYVCLCVCVGLYKSLCVCLCVCMFIQNVCLCVCLYRMCVCVCVFFQYVCVCVRARVCHGGSGACTAASLQEGQRFDSRMGRCWLWGAGPPQTFSARGGAISRAFLCGVCVFTRGFLH